LAVKKIKICCCLPYWQNLLGEFGKIKQTKTNHSRWFSSVWITKTKKIWNLYHNNSDVNDICTAMEVDLIEDFLIYLNSIEPSIEFTIEINVMVNWHFWTLRLCTIVDSSLLTKEKQHTRTNIFLLTPITHYIIKVLLQKHCLIEQERSVALVRTQPRKIYMQLHL